MLLIENNIKWIMLVAGVMTCTMVIALVSPQTALMQTFGQTLDHPLAELVVRSWGALITLVGAMLIFGAFRPVHRDLVILVATVSKLIFVGLVVSLGNHYLDTAMLTIAFDSVVALIFLVYLVGKGKRKES
ncbi:hypothetical protein [Marinomonas sp. THO17]|uniref:hypothetical protein n=1 Tax=Marinomonas sp. THO17 TaxID=3149048 RepID=UPI00336BB999